MTSNMLNKEEVPVLLHPDELERYNEGDYAVMAEVKAVLARHNALSRFGITLLHNHFPVAEDEVMVEFEDISNRTLTIKPMKVDQLKDQPGDLVETQWRLDIPNVLASAVTTYKTDVTGKHFTISG